MPLPLDDWQRFHKPIRLPKQNYIGYRAYFLTVCTCNRIPYLSSARLAHWVLDLLRRCAIQYSFSLRAYCLMPDHIHLLAQGDSPAANLLPFVKTFKHRTSFSFHRKTGKRLWQISFFDHILRTAEDLSESAEYILSNPVRDGLVVRREDYPFCGTAPAPQRAPAKRAGIPPSSGQVKASATCKQEES